MAVGIKRHLVLGRCASAGVGGGAVANIPQNSEIQKAMNKRCPFCGKPPSIHKGKRRANGKWLWHPSVNCNGCGIRFESSDYIPKTPEELLEKWNTRKP